MLFIFNLLPYSASPPGIYLNEHIKIYGFNLRDFFQSNFWIMVNQNVSRKNLQSTPIWVFMFLLITLLISSFYDIFFSLSLSLVEHYPN